MPTAFAPPGYDTRICVTEFGWPSAEGLDGARPGFEFALDQHLGRASGMDHHGIEQYGRLGIRLARLHLEFQLWTAGRI